MLLLSAWKPASVTNWNLYPMAPSSRWNLAMVASSRFFFQLKLGEQLYASILFGNFARTPSAKRFACARHGVDVSHHTRSAYGAYATARAIAVSTPLLNL